MLCVGSLKIKILACDINQRMRISFCCSPPDKWHGMAPGLAGILSR